MSMPMSMPAPSMPINAHAHVHGCPRPCPRPRLGPCPCPCPYPCQCPCPRPSPSPRAGRDTCQHERQNALRRRSFCRILQDGKAALGQHCRHHHRPARRDGRPGTWGGCGARRALAGCAHESAGARSAERARGFCRDSAGFSSQNRQPVRAEAGQWAKRVQGGRGGSRTGYVTTSHATRR